MARKGGMDRGITQRKGRPGWWVRIYVNGREKWFKCDNKSQAKALYGRLRADAREGRYFPEKFTPKKEVSLRAWILRYLAGSTNKGLINERRYGRRWSLLIGRRALDQITTEELRRIQVMFKAKDKWSNGTINRHFAFLRHVLMVAIRDGKLERNPITGLRFLPEEKTTRFFSDDELNTLKKEIPTVEWKLVEFAVETGLRRDEQFRLRWDQVDLETAILTIPLPKGGKTRHVPLSDRALEILRSLDSFISSPWVFPNPKQPLRGRNAQSFVNHVFTPALLNTKIEGTCWHTLRHTAASRRVMAGVDLVSVKEILGHRDIQTTLRYAHLAPGHLKDAVNKGSLGTASSKVSKS